MDISNELYDAWNGQKKMLATKIEKQLSIKEGEVWWGTLGINIGTETYGKGPNFKRPILILKRLSRENCLILPITSKRKSGNWFSEIIILEAKDG